MVYLHATLQLAPYKSREFGKFLATTLVPLFEKHGAKLIGSWETFLGNQSEITDIWGFDSLAHFEASTLSLLQDPQWASVQETMSPMVISEKTKLLAPLKCSPLK